MKCTGISLGNTSKDNRTLEQFVGSPEADNPLGQLLIALTNENTWSVDYTVSAHFHGDEPRMYISHDSFLPERSLSISADTSNLSVRGVEDAVRAHLRESQESMWPAISILQHHVNGLYQTFEQIDTDKARAAVVKAFPEAKGAEYSPAMARGGLHCFHNGGINQTPIFVAREINHEFVGGVARIIGCSAFEWYGMSDGVKASQRHGVFWIYLAIQFVAREFQVNEKEIYFQSISVTEKPFEVICVQPPIDPYIVEKVLLRITCHKKDVVVEFGSDNLPAKVYIVRMVSQG